jgi:hypothetical protein
MGSISARGPVSRVLSRARYPCGRTHGGSHSSRRPVARPLQQPTRASRGETPLPLLRKAWARDPYSVLLRAGFAMRTPLPEPRCALTAPFHPCLCPLGAIGGILSVALSLGPGPKPLARRGLPATLVSRSPDFPRRKLPPDAAARPPGAAYLVRPLSRSKSNWNRIARTSPSITPSMRSGRQRRWNASTALRPSVMS